MKTIALLIISLIIGFLWLSCTQFQLHPFKVSFGRWMLALGFMLIFAGVGFLQYYSEGVGRKEAFEELLEILKDSTRDIKEL